MMGVVGVLGVVAGRLFDDASECNFTSALLVTWSPAHSTCPSESLCLCVCVSLCMSVCMSLWMSVWISLWMLAQVLFLRLDESLKGFMAAGEGTCEKVGLLWWRLHDVMMSRCYDVMIS